MIRVLIAEDSPTTTLFLVRLLESDSTLQVVGRASNGLEAVAMNEALQPDVIVMDIYMPELDGFEATRRIMIESPTPIVIVSASLDSKSVDVSLHALRLGALSVLEKPRLTALEEDADAAHFVSTVRAMAGVKVVRHWRSELPAPPSDGPSARGELAVVAMAASTGGPSALLRVLAELPRSLPVPILIVQHMARGFMPGLASWLGQGTAMEVRVAQQGAALENGVVYLAPDDRHLGLRDRRTLLVSAAPPRGGFRPSGSVLFESVAAVYGASAAGVILTGMGDDGTEGLGRLRLAGGRIIAQDEASSVVFGMPAAAIAAGLPHVTLPIELIGPRIRAWAGTTRNSDPAKGCSK